MQRDVDSPEAYRAAVPEAQRELCEAIRELIFEAAPDAEEIVEYGMLGYPGIGNLAAQKQYVSLYVSPAVLDHHRESLGKVSCGKSCIRFRRLQQLDRGRLRALLDDLVR